MASLKEQIEELVGFLSVNCMAEAQAADAGKKAAGVRLRKMMQNLSKQAVVIRFNAYQAAYGREPKSKGGIRDETKG